MRLHCTVEYDGTEFAGWQRQTARPTVQGALEEAIAAITGHVVDVVGAGRTDAGVHAVGQVAHFDTNWNRSLGELQRALNALLPPDVAVRKLTAAPPGFHARHSAVGRAYSYTVWAGGVRSPLVRRTTYHVRGPLAVARISEAAGALLGEHDFGGFGRPMTPEGSTVRCLTRLDVIAEGARVRFDVEANAFLRHQVRRTVGLLLDIGTGRIGPEATRQVLARTPDAPVARRVPPQGLVLVAVRYPLEESFGESLAPAAN